MIEQGPIFNLGDKRERDEFIATYGTLKGRALANRLHLSGKGSARLATAISCYAWNAHTANECRLRGEIQTATLYENIMDRLYTNDLINLEWW